MKLLIVAPYYIPRIGGLERYAHEMALGSKASGIDVVVVAAQHTAEPEVKENIDGVPVYRLRTQIKVSNTPVSLAWRTRLKQIIETERPDIINVHLPVPFIADIATRVAGKVPVIVTYHNDLVKRGLLAPIVPAYYNMMGKATLARAVKIICTSEHYANLSPWIKPFRNKVTIIPPGVNKVQSRKQHSTRNKLQAIFVAQLDETHSWKGLSVLLVALTKVPDVILRVVGEGNARERYEHEVRTLKLGDRVSFSGALHGNNLEKAYKDADVIVLPSTNDTEGFGMVLLEAAAAGTPAVASLVGGIPFAVQHNKTGLLVPPSDVEKLAESLHALNIDRKRLADLGESARKRAEKEFLWSAQVKKYLETINSVYNQTKDKAANKKVGEQQ